MALNLPHSWKDMPHYAQSQYLINTHQAKGFSHAAEVIAAHKKANKPPAAKPTVRQIRLPYADN